MRTVSSLSSPEHLAAQLSRLARERGRSKNDIVKDSVGQHLWEVRFRAVRRQLIRRAKGAGPERERDVFRAVS